MSERPPSRAAPLPVAQDALDYAAFLDTHATVKAGARLGVFGYCMGAR